MYYGSARPPYYVHQVYILEDSEPLIYLKLIIKRNIPIQFKTILTTK